MSADPLSPLLMAGELAVLGEFPEPTYARQALTAIGTGETTFAAIASEVGGGAAVPSGTLAPVLTKLLERQVVAADTPLSTRADQRNRRYRVADQYLRFWLAFLQRGIAESERGRGDLVLRRIERSWPGWRGRAVEPLVRDSLARLLPDDRWPLGRPFEQRDLDQLVQDRPAVPGADATTALVTVSRAGFQPGLPLAQQWTPEDLVRAWAPPLG